MYILNQSQIGLLQTFTHTTHAVYAANKTFPLSSRRITGMRV
jgi:hypothetical protein